MQLARVRFYLELALLFIGAMGNVFLWFQADWQKKSWAYMGVMVSNIVLVAAATPTIPERYKKTARTLSIFFLLNFQEHAICSARTFFDSDHKNANVTDDQYRLVRCGAFFALFAGYAIFFESVVLPQSTASTLLNVESLKSVRGLMFLVAALFLCISQFITWGIKDNCDTQKVPSGVNLNATPLTMALILVMGVVFGDRELIDLGVFLCMTAFNKFQTIFQTDGAQYQQAHIKSIWRAQMAFGFMALIIVMLGQLQHSARFARIPDVAIASRIKSLRFGALVFLTLLGIAGSACIWARVPAKGREQATSFEADLAWWGGFGGWFVPILCLIGYVIGCSGFGIIGAFIGITALTVFANALDGSQATGYLRGGAVLTIIVSFFSPVVALTEKVEFAENPEVYFEGTNKTPMWLCMLLGACAVLWWDDTSFGRIFWAATGQFAVFFFAAASTGDVNLYKLVSLSLFAMQTVPQMWPIAHHVFTSTPASIAFVIVGWACAAYVVFAFPGAPFDAFHGAEHVEMIEAQTAFIEKKGDADEGSVARMYVGGNNSGKEEVGGGITEEA